MFTTKRKGIIALLCAVFAAALIACAISLAPSATRTAPVYATEGYVAAIGDTNYTSLKGAIDAAGDTATTITLLTNTAENITIASGQDITLALDGFDITVETGNAITNNGTLTIQGTSFAVISTDDETGYAVNNTGTLAIEGGYFKNGLSIPNAESVSISGGAFANAFDESFVAEGSVFYPAEDGTYKVVTEEEFETVTDNAGVALMNGVVYVSLADAVDAAPTDGTQVTITLIDTDGDGIVTGSGVKVVEGKKIVIDFDGLTYDVTNPVGSPGTETNGFQLLKGSTVKMMNGTLVSDTAKILIQNYCDLTIDDMTLDMSDCGQVQYVISNNSGNTVITGDTTIVAAPNQVAFDIYYGLGATYYDGVSVTFDENFTGSVTGKVEYGASAGGAGQEGWLDKTQLTIESGTFDIDLFVHSNNTEMTEEEADEAAITISGGTFTQEVNTAYIADGAVLYTTDGDSFTVGTDDEAIDAGISIIIDGIGYTKIPESVVATVGAEGKVPAGYESLQDAIDAAADGDTITLVRDITTTSYTVINDKDITIDLADFTITATGCDETYSSLLFIQGGSNVTIENGSLVGDFETSGINFDVIYLNSSNLTLNDVNISAAHDYMDGILFYGGMTNSDAVTAYNNKDFSNYYTLNVNNSTVVGYWYAIDGNAAGTHDGTIININNSTVTDATDVIGEPSGTAIFHPHFGILNVSGDDTLISGATGIEMRAGELNISGGNIVGNNEFMTSASGNGNSVFGAAVAVSQHTTNLLISVNVTGGTLETVGNAVYALYENDLMNDGDVDDITISVTGGTFNGEVYSENCTEFIAGGQFVVKPDDTYLAEGFSGFSEYNGMFVPVTSSTEGTMLEEIEQIRQEIADAIAEVNGALAGGDATTLAESMTKLIDRMSELEAMIGELDESMVTSADLAALRGSVTAAYTAAVSQVRAQLSAQIDDLREAIAGMGDVSAELEELRAAYEAADELLSADIADVSAELEAAISELESAYGEADDAIWNAIYALRDADSGMTAALWVVGVIAVLALCAGVAGVAFAIVRTKRS